MGTGICRYTMTIFPGVVESSLRKCASPSFSHVTPAGCGQLSGQLGSLVATEKSQFVRSDGADVPLGVDGELVSPGVWAEIKRLPPVIKNRAVNKMAVRGENFMVLFGWGFGQN